MMLFAVIRLLVWNIYPGGAGKQELTKVGCHGA